MHIECLLWLTKILSSLIILICRPRSKIIDLFLDIVDRRIDIVQSYWDIFITFIIKTNILLGSIVVLIDIVDSVGESLAIESTIELMIDKRKKNDDTAILSLVSTTGLRELVIDRTIYLAVENNE